MRRALALTALIFSFAFVAAPASFARGDDDKSADQMLRSIDELKPPVFDTSKQNDGQYQQSYRKEYEAYAEKRQEMIYAFYKAFPRHDRAPKLMEEWMRSLAGPGDDKKCDEAIAKLDGVLASNPTPEMKSSAEFYKGQYAFYKPLGRLGGYRDGHPATGAAKARYAREAGDAIEAYVKAHPSDDRAARWYGTLAMALDDEKMAKPFYEKALAHWPDAKYTAYFKGKLRQMESGGKAFDLSFNDAVTGKPFSMADVRGKVVMVDFFATWCGPCRAEMPEVKKLYAQYHDQGLEIVTVSLDQPVDKGGLDALKKYVADNQITWPQYYQGNFWDSEFSKKWGINAIPTMFLVDKKGNLRYVDAREDKERKIKELLAEKD